ncbi:hypothetical protein K503DRAFT_435037 [Rhizopogon vinicolor AM-OR11-026]|uniref:Uncharacterized protein n=1 Tax=Rhizopogon vinicolor AM-OR11-026 TaxID=1314800 RepID=A0A1B7MPQ2_9AGAM|nr:hypothetical protein K503DRAFT_435037 [Rhizopogon vinicolor AM-OR11-026]
MAKCFHQSKEAFTRKQRRLARELSLKGQARKETWCVSTRKQARRYFKRITRDADPIQSIFTDSMSQKPSSTSKKLY